jgi:hypothetical protein
MRRLRVGTPRSIARNDQAAFERFMVQDADAYAALDDALAGVSRRGNRLGGFVRR